MREIGASSRHQGHLRSEFDIKSSDLYYRKYKDARNLLKLFHVSEVYDVNIAHNHGLHAELSTKKGFLKDQKRKTK